MDNAKDLINAILSGQFDNDKSKREEPEVRRFSPAELVDLMLFELGIGVADF